MTDSEAVPTIDPTTAALLVMDYQNGIVGSLPDADALIARAESAVATARAAGMLVGYVRVGFEDADLASIPSTNKAFSTLAATRRVGNADDPSTAILDRLTPHDGDIVVRKTRVGPFSSTDLGERLATAGVTTLVLAGVSTGGVVLSTVRHAADHDFRLYVLADACADRDPAVHEVLVGKVFPRQAYTIEVADLPALLG